MEGHISTVSDVLVGKCSAALAGEVVGSFLGTAQLCDIDQPIVGFSGFGASQTLTHAASLDLGALAGISSRCPWPGEDIAVQFKVVRILERHDGLHGSSVLRARLPQGLGKRGLKSQLLETIAKDAHLGLRVVGIADEAEEAFRRLHHEGPLTDVLQHLFRPTTAIDGLVQGYHSESFLGDSRGYLLWGAVAL